MSDAERKRRAAAVEARALAIVAELRQQVADGAELTATEALIVRVGEMGRTIGDAEHLVITRADVGILTKVAAEVLHGRTEAAIRAAAERRGFTWSGPGWTTRELDRLREALGDGRPLRKIAESGEW